MIRPRPNAFTIIELIVVLVILALVTAVVALRVRSPLRQTRWADLLDGIIQYENHTRVQARQSGRPMHLVYHMDRHRIERMDAEEHDQLGREFNLPEGFRLRRLLIDDNDIRRGSAAVAVGQAGMSRSYGLEIEDPDGVRRRLVFLGLSGQWIEPDDDTQIQNILSCSRVTKRPDAR